MQVCLNCMALVLLLSITCTELQSAKTEMYIVGGKIYQPKADSKKTYGTVRPLTRKQKIQQGLIHRRQNDHFADSRNELRLKVVKKCVSMKVVTKHLKWQSKRTAQDHINASTTHTEKNLVLIV